MRIQQKITAWKLASHLQLKPDDTPSPVLVSGTLICQGEGTFMVIAVGEHSALGQIRAALKEEREENTPL